jgi:hypothetical protein
MRGRTGTGVKWPVSGKAYQYYKEYEQISPFELTERLLELAHGHERTSTRALLDAGRGNPNWVCATPREAFFALGQFALTECRRIWNDADLAGKPRRGGIAQRCGIRKGSRRGAGDGAA